jgi:hypothetical protein
MSTKYTITIIVSKKIFINFFDLLEMSPYNYGMNRRYKKKKNGSIIFLGTFIVVGIICIIGLGAFIVDYERAKEVTSGVVSDANEFMESELGIDIDIDKLESGADSETVSKVKKGVKKGVKKAKEVKETLSEDGILSDASDINLHDVDGKGKNYVFTYDGVEYSAVYTKDNWKIIDSYKIENSEDMKIICSALIEEHPVHGSDMQSYRTADDMVYEWEQHNIAYAFLPDDNRWKARTKDVDLNPEDQNLSFAEIYERQTGKKMTIDELMKHVQEG